MAEDTPPYIPPGAEDDESSDVLGKLDELLKRHKPRTPGAEAVPILTDALPEADADAIPTLTDIVSRPDPPRREAPGEYRLEGAGPERAGLESAGLESSLVQRLGMRLEVERARLLGEGGGTQVGAEVLGELVDRLRESLPDIVRMALNREERKAALKTSGPVPDDENR